MGEGQLQRWTRAWRVRHRARRLPFVFNGQLLAQSPGPRRPLFVPLTVLPGDNVLAVVAASGSGEPAVLLQLDELERSYVSGSAFRVSTRPGAGFATIDYDDSDWSLAKDLGARGALPGCDPTSVFPDSTNAHWMAPLESAAAAVFRLKLRVAAQGFGATATGGGRSAPVLAKSIAELQTLLAGDTAAVILLPEGHTDHRPTGNDVVQQQVCPEPCDEDASKTSYRVLTQDATCATPQVNVARTDRRTTVGSNKTLVGLGRGAQLRGASFVLSQSRNVVLRNLAIYDVNRTLIEAGDGIELDQPDGVWIDHVTFRWISDGFTDARLMTRNVTISWSHYAGRNEGVCAERHPRAAQLSGTTATLHHNRWEQVAKRAPLSDQADSRLHLFDNVVRDDTDYAFGAACGAELLVEGNTFEDVRYPTLRTTCPDAGVAVGLIRAPVGANLYRGNNGPHRINSTDSPEPNDSGVFDPPYVYTLEKASDAWPNVLARAGAGGPWALPLSLD